MRIVLSVYSSHWPLTHCRQVQPASLLSHHSHSVLLWLQDGLWFSLGCAASQVGDLDLSIKAWHRAVALQPDVGASEDYSVLMLCVFLVCRMLEQSCRSLPQEKGQVSSETAFDR